MSECIVNKWYVTGIKCNYAKFPTDLYKIDLGNPDKCLCDNESVTDLNNFHFACKDLCDKYFKLIQRLLKCPNTVSY